MDSVQIMGSSCFPDEDDVEEVMNLAEENANDNGQEAGESTEVVPTPESGKRKDSPESKFGIGDDNGPEA
ncbi:unnamed protein product [Eruca vesicaria subsp. sativa]|uniref:Uncharacterized protein n=1 Tax=Eruca vesicaria subsp. sativa TaxID=29727 RepID=A0ABC8K4R1_ERUVS|nr:unnamed protein product [Eruca vesicaria subsp. sativa]